MLNGKNMDQNFKFISINKRNIYYSPFSIKVHVSIMEKQNWGEKVFHSG